MKNKEKYESEADALFAFSDECYHKHNRDCLNCPYRGVAGEDKFCMVRWLYSEAEMDADAEAETEGDAKNNNNNSISDTTKKSLSELCRIYCDLSEGSSNIKEKLDKKILEIIKLYDSRAYLIDNYTTLVRNRDLLEVEYLSLRYGYSEASCRSIPIKWLDFEIDEIIKIIVFQEGKIDNEE